MRGRMMPLCQMTVSDKKTLKMMAMEQKTTIAAIIHEWIVEHQKEVDE